MFMESSCVTSVLTTVHDDQSIVFETAFDEDPVAESEQPGKLER